MHSQEHRAAAALPAVSDSIRQSRIPRISSVSSPGHRMVQNGNPQQNPLHSSAVERTEGASLHAQNSTGPSLLTSEATSLSIDSATEPLSPVSTNQLQSSTSTRSFQPAMPVIITKPTIQPHEADLKQVKFLSPVHQIVSQGAGGGGQSTDVQQLPEPALGSKPEAKLLDSEKGIAKEVQSADQLWEVSFIEPNSTITKTSLASSTESLASSEHSEHSRLSSTSLASRQSLPASLSKSAFTTFVEQQAAYQSISLPQLGDKSRSIANPQRYIWAHILYVCII